MAKQAYMIIDMQYGSTGKGLLAGTLAEMRAPDVVVTAWGPNAGHTYINYSGREFIHRMLANGIVSPALEKVLIGPGSVIDMEVLLDEINGCVDLLKGKTIIIHPHAAVVRPCHLETEKSLVKIGSTMKGTGAAVIDRIMRDPHNNNCAYNVLGEYIDHMVALAKHHEVMIVVSKDMYESAIDEAELLQIEGAQGFSLSIYNGMYPYTTSRDVSTAQVLADCAIPRDTPLDVYGTLRTYPIRVSNRKDEEGNVVGTSGPCYDDQEEIEWSSIGLEPEKTTVTKLPRRIFTFSLMQLMEADRIIGPDFLFLNFANYLEKEEVESMVKMIELETGKPVVAIGYGPTFRDVKFSDFDGHSTL